MARLKPSSPKYQEENKALFEDFLQNTFFKVWSGVHPERENYGTLELFLSPLCNLRCKYCYLARHKELCPIVRPEKIVQNSKLLIKWLKEQSFSPAIEIFSGEPLVKSWTFPILEEILKQLDKPYVIVPTNGTFIKDKQTTEKIRQLLRIYHESGGRIFLSFSIDGPFLQENRPPIKFSYADYLQLFAIAKEWKYGFHPMIYSAGIEKWIYNFKWFIGMMKKTGISPMHLYLLEVRNPEWSMRQCLYMAKFSNFLAKYLLCRDRKFFEETRGFNFFSLYYSRVGRGIGCSIQSTLHVRVPDLAIVPCHRLAYRHLITAHLKLPNFKIEPWNVPFFFAIQGYNLKHAPFCESCLLRPICPGGCLGAQYEVFGDPFIPIPTVCLMEHAKALGFLTALEDLDKFHSFVDVIPEEKRIAFENLREVKNEIFRRFQKGKSISVRL